MILHALEAVGVCATSAPHERAAPLNRQRHLASLHCMGSAPVGLGWRDRRRRRRPNAVRADGHSRRLRESGSGPAPVLRGLDRARMSLAQARQGRRYGLQPMQGLASSFRAAIQFGGAIAHDEGGRPPARVGRDGAVLVLRAIVVTGIAPLPRFPSLPRGSGARPSRTWARAGARLHDSGNSGACAGASSGAVGSARRRPRRLRARRIASICSISGICSSPLLRLCRATV